MLWKLRLLDSLCHITRKSETKQWNGVFTFAEKSGQWESLRNCDVRQVLCILTTFCRFKPKNVCILPKFWSFQSFQSKIILVKCCKEVIVPPEYFSNFPCLSVNVFVCMFVYIVRTDQNPLGSCQPFSILYILWWQHVQPLIELSVVLAHFFW